MIPRSKLYYFVEDQVILHLEHMDDVDTDDLLKRITDYLNAVAEPLNRLDPVTVRWITTFPIIRSPDTRRIISLVSTQLKALPHHEHETLERDEYSDQDDLVALLGEIYAWIVNNGPERVPIDDEVSLRTVSPNWLTSGAPHLPGVGGPGALPVSADPQGNEWKFNFPNLPNSSDFINPEAGGGVEVAILDTVPIGERRDIDRKWPDHPLIQRLVGNGGKLEIFPYQAGWKDFCYSLVGHRYQMHDHGLFVAGIINTIAPEADLKLYEVLNSYGAGSYASISDGLTNALNGHVGGAGKKLVVNLSLVLNMPVMDPRYKYKQADQGLTERYITLEGRNCIHRMGASVREILTLLADLPDVYIVAAAGNGAEEGTRPWARYPAVSPQVIGVGALPRGSQPRGQVHQDAATYSNLCDRPLSSGYMTLGGEPGPDNGVLGVYIHDIPIDHGSRNISIHGRVPVPGHLRASTELSPALADISTVPNGTGWAWWAGTSFAVPIISGLLAAAWSHNWPGAQDAHTFLDNSSLHNNLTGDNEKVIYVTQP